MSTEDTLRYFIDVNEDTLRYCVWYLVSKGRLDLVIDEPVDEYEEEPEV